MRKAYVGVTDGDWYEFLSHRPELTEVNFWQPGGRVLFQALGPGELFLFKLHSPNNFVVGGGFFATASLLPVSLAWDTFGPMNGVASLEQMRARIEKLRREKPDPGEDYTIGNVVLEQAFFFRRERWISAPNDFHPNIVQGKGYDLTTGTGLELWNALEDRLSDSSAAAIQRNVADGTVKRMFSDPTLAKRRLGQGAFRVLITDHYNRQCAATREHTLPVLEAAHIKPVVIGGEHAISNGLLLRSDVHTLFDRGYVSVSPDYKFLVSDRLSRNWQNGKVYYAIRNTNIHLPSDRTNWPSRELLEWHSQEVFLR